ncbi:SDR family NAD(P)-dependent oxidoreductase [Pseudomonas sp. 3JA]|uniref:SDR family NAD(P)-dependent oxidoreductase n=1 Tax=Pseudomonas sp. 3JA TaxID=3109347 RepID=UPI00300975BC
MLAASSTSTQSSASCLFLTHPLYSASKHAVEGYSQALDHELRTHGIRVTVVEPGYTKTQFESNNLQPDAKLDVYEDIRIKVTKVVNQAMATADGPDVVAEVVLQVARAEHPKLRYTAGKAAGQLQFMRSFVPARLLDTGIRRALQLETKWPSQAHCGLAIPVAVSVASAGQR